MAEIPRFPPSFRIEEIKTDGATIHVRVGGAANDTGRARQPGRHRRVAIVALAKAHHCVLALRH